MEWYMSEKEEWNMFKTNNKDTKMTSTASIVDFELVYVRWDGRYCATKYWDNDVKY